MAGATGACNSLACTHIARLVVIDCEVVCVFDKICEVREEKDFLEDLWKVTCETLGVNYLE